tara:strand:+ start:201 stop:410 length:210 start_codon:yes stop_codon:yes gene_type:complete
LKVNKTQHFRTLELKQLPEFLQALERNEARLYERTRRAVWLSLIIVIAKRKRAKPPSALKIISITNKAL